jgi:SpoIID/LytB domain protein
VPLSSGLQDQAVKALVAAAVVIAAAASTGQQPPPPGAAFFVRSLSQPSDRREARPEVLDTPVLPGSVMKVVTLAAALEAQVIEPDMSRICRRIVTIEGRRYVCAHPDLKRPLSPAEALAHSCNDFFVSLAPRLSRASFDDVRRRVGLPPVGATANLAASFVGLDGPRVSPRALLDVVARLAGADPDRPVQIAAATRRVVLDGLKGAAEYGTASALAARRVPALAKTGTAPMPGGSWMGLAVVLTPPERPTRGAVVVAPGAAGLDAAAIAADLLGSSSTESSTALTVRLGATQPGGGTRVETLALEDYVARVVTGEGQPRAADAAQRALAIAARTFALANRNRHRREGYDLCDTTHCQVLRPASAPARRAAQDTAGRVLVRQGQPASIFYSALCGGRAERAADVWPGALDLAAAEAPDEACAGEPGWASELAVGEIERALRAAGHRGDRLRGLRILSRNQSGRVARVRVEGFVPDELAGHELRMAIGRVAGWQHVKSTLFDVRRTSRGYRFEGRGSGHGVGLCVIGAGHRAAAGRTAEDILRFYFPGLAIDTYRAPETMTAATKTITPAAPALSARADVLVGLPAGEEVDRAHLVDIVRRARDDIAAAAGVKAPASIRVSVHPTVEAFARATGQPWWVSGATDGTNIDLLPLAILRQQGQLEHTVRHEVAHVLIDSLLTGRPLWVREGAARYFAAAASAAAPDPPLRGTCPTDDEFSRPLSAGTHRAAYARAEACVRRAIAAGKTWREIK